MVLIATLPRLLSALARPERLLLCCLCLSMVACAKPSALERDFGQAWAYNQAIQIVNPAAGLSTPPATGLPPQAGAKVMQAYDKSFEKKEAGGGSTTINLSPMAAGGGK